MGWLRRFRLKKPIISKAKHKRTEQIGERGHER